MLGEFMLRLAIALPLIALLAVLVLVSLRRFAPGLLAGRPRRRHPAAQPLELLQSCVLTPAARLVVVSFNSRELLIGVTGQSLTLIADSSATPFTLPPAPDSAGGAE